MKNQELRILKREIERGRSEDPEIVIENLGRAREDKKICKIME